MPKTVKLLDMVRREFSLIVNFVRVCKDEDLLLCVLNEDCVSLFVVDVSSWVLRNTHKTLTPTYDKHRSWIQGHALFNNKKGYIPDIIIGRGHVFIMRRIITSGACDPASVKITCHFLDGQMFMYLCMYPGWCLLSRILHSQIWI